MFTKSYDKSSKLTLFMIIIMVLCAFRFYNYYQIDNNIQKLPGMLLVPFLIVLTWRQLLLKEKEPCFKIIRLLLVSWILSMIMAYAFWNQSFTLSYRVTAQNMSFVIFFYFCKKKLSRATIEDVIIFFGWLYIILWLYAMYRAPSVTFGNDDEDITNMQRGMLRINFIGRLSLVLAYFFYLNKSFLERNPKYKIFAVVFFVFIVLQLTRQLILWAGVVTLIFIFLRSRKLALFLSILFFSMYVGSVNIKFSDNSIIGSMINLTNDQMNGDVYSGEDPRVTEYKYFFFEWSKNIVTQTIGNGMPHTDSNYGHYYTNLQNEGLFLSDVGYPSMFVILGVFGIILYISLFIRGTFVKLPRELSYVNMFMGFMIPANIAASWYMGADTQLALCICAYLIYAYRRKPQLLNLKKDEI